MTPNPQAHDPRSRMALACSTLARAGQQLSVATNSEQGRAALHQVAGLLEADQNLAGHFPVEEMAQKCRVASEQQEDGQLLATCRQIATTLARRASSLAAEIQHQPKAAASAPAGRAAVQTATPRPDSPRAVVAPTPPPATVQPPPPPAAARPQPTSPVRHRAPAPAPKAPARQPIDPAQVRRITIARTAPEQAAAAEALSQGQRFAMVSQSTLIDTLTNRMWAAQAVPGLTRPAAEAALSRLHQGDYGDWRLPTPEELKALLAQDGRRWLQEASVLSASLSADLWTSQIRSRFFGWKKDAAVVHSGTGETRFTGLSDASVLTLAVRG